MFIFKTAWKSYCKNNEKIPGNLQKDLEISWNFVSPEKWEPCTRLPTICVSVTTTSCRYQFFLGGGGVGLQVNRSQVKTTRCQ